MSDDLVPDRTFRGKAEDPDLLPYQPKRLQPFRLHAGALMVILFATAATVFITWSGADVLGGTRPIEFGEEGVIPPFSYRIQHVEVLDEIGIGALKEYPEDAFIVVQYLLQNTDGEMRGVNEGVVTLANEEGLEVFPACRSDIGNCAGHFPESIEKHFLRPGEEVEGTYVFDVDPQKTWHFKVIHGPVSGNATLFTLE